MDNNRVKYLVIKDKGIVKASINSCKFDALNAFNDKFVSSVTRGIYLRAGGNSWWSGHGNEQVLMPDYFQAVAKLSSEDQWDEELGKKIALKKLSEKYNKSLDRHIKNIYMYLGAVVQKADEYLKDRI